MKEKLRKFIDWILDREKKVIKQKTTSSEVNNGIIININIDGGKK